MTFEQANALGDWIVIGALIACVIVLARRLDVLRDWKRQIEGKTEFGDWLLVSKQEWDDFRKYVYAFEWDHHDRLKKLERGVRIEYRRPLMPNKWKPWAR